MFDTVIELVYCVVNLHFRFHKFLWVLCPAFLAEIRERSLSDLEIELSVTCLERIQEWTYCPEKIRFLMLDNIYVPQHCLFIKKRSAGQFLE